MQDELDCELVIAAGAETETRRIQEIINEESSLARLNPTYMPLGLSEGFLCLSQMQVITSRDS